MQAIKTKRFLALSFGHLALNCFGHLLWMHSISQSLVEGNLQFTAFNCIIIINSELTHPSCFLQKVMAGAYTVPPWYLHALSFIYCQ